MNNIPDYLDEDGNKKVQILEEIYMDIGAHSRKVAPLR